MSKRQNGDKVESKISFNVDSRVLYVHRCATMEVTKKMTKFLYTVEVRFGLANETVIRYINPNSRILFYNNYTVAENNPVYPSLVLGHVVPCSYQNGSRQELSLGFLGKWLFILKSLMLRNQTWAIKHNRTALVGCEVNNGSEGNYFYKIHTSTSLNAR